MRKLLVGVGFSLVFIYLIYQKADSPAELGEQMEVTPLDSPKLDPSPRTKSPTSPARKNETAVVTPPVSPTPSPSLPPLDPRLEQMVKRFRQDAKAKAGNSGEKNIEVPRPVVPPGRIGGRVLAFAGLASANPETAMTGDPDCAAFAPPRNTNPVTGNVGLANAFVYLEGSFGKPAAIDSLSPAVIEVTKCRFSPRVFGVRVGQRVRFRYQDSIRYRIETADEGITPAQIDFSPTYQSEPIEKMVRFSAPGTMLNLRSTYHSWMQVFVGVLPHDYFAVTDTEGFFSLPQPPDSIYTVHVWHETAGEASKRVSLIMAKTIPDILYK